jgi:hypothetical protein
MDEGPGPSTFVEYRRHYYLITLGFLVIWMIGYSLIARWLYRSGPDVEALSSHSAPQENAVQN